MTYRELLELYSQGRLDEQQKIEVEKELEKQEALADYLFEHQAPPGMEDFFDGTPAFGANAEDADGEAPETSREDSEAIAKQINRSIRKAFIKTGVIAVIIGLILTLFVVFALPHIVSAFYYDPGKTSTELGTDDSGMPIEQLERDMSVFAELSIPELGPQITVGTDSFGYGNYSFYIDSASQVGSDSNTTTINSILTGNIKRNSFVCYNYKELATYLESHDFAYEDSDREIDRMKSGELYYAYVKLRDVMPYETFYADFVHSDEYGTNGSWVWCAIRTCRDETMLDFLDKGFYATVQGHSAEYGYDDNAYPMLAWADETGSLSGDVELDTEKKAYRHFNSMLKYMLDCNKFRSLKNQISIEVSEEDKDYIEENGLGVYGFIYVSDKEHIETLARAKSISKVFINRAF